MANCEERGIEGIFKNMILGRSYNRSSAKAVITPGTQALLNVKTPQVESFEGKSMTDNKDI